MAPSGFVYGVEPALSAAEFRRVLVASGLDARRPAEEPERLERMLRAATLIVTARACTPERTLVGVARALTDFSFCTYVSDLAVARAQQGGGIGRGLLDMVREKAGPEATLILLAAPGVEGYYAHIGLERVAHAFKAERTR